MPRRTALVEAERKAGAMNRTLFEGTCTCMRCAKNRRQAYALLVIPAQAGIPLHGFQAIQGLGPGLRRDDVCFLLWDRDDAVADNRLVPLDGPPRKLHPGAGGVCARFRRA